MAKKYLDITGLAYFWVKVKAYIDNHGGGGGASVLDCYPVGSYYETSDSTFNPNISWGGTWVLEAEGLVHIGAGSNYTIGDTGGEVDHTLTVNEMPSHTHIQDSHNHAQNPHSHQIKEQASSVASGSKYARPRTESYSGSYGYVTSSVTATNIAATATNQNTGGGQPHNNMQPYKVVNRWHRTA